MYVLLYVCMSTSMKLAWNIRDTYWYREGKTVSIDNTLSLLSYLGADPGGGRKGARPPSGWSFTIQNALFNNIQAPVQHWAPIPGRNRESATAIYIILNHHYITSYINIQAPVQHWAPIPGRNRVSATAIYIILNHIQIHILNTDLLY